MVYLCIEEEDYEYTEVNHIYTNLEDALEWLKNVDMGSWATEGKRTMYGKCVQSNVVHLKEGDDDPNYSEWQWDELWYRYNGYSNWWRVEKRTVA
jgi:hypothetical protein